MGLKVTTKDGVIIEGDSAQEVIAALRTLQEPALGANYVPPQKGSGRRTPRGKNKKVVLQILAAANGEGLNHARVQERAKAMKGIELAPSSVHHALVQLLKLKQASRTEDLWYVTGAGLKELAKIEEEDRGIGL